MAFQRDQFLLRYIAAVIGVRLLASLAVALECFGDWSTSRCVCGDAAEVFEAAFETALAATLALLSSSGLREVSQRWQADREQRR